VVLVYDTGALVAAERRDRAMWALHDQALVGGIDLVVPVVASVTTPAFHAKAAIPGRLGQDHVVHRDKLAYGEIYGRHIAISRLIAVSHHHGTGQTLDRWAEAARALPMGSRHGASSPNAANLTFWLIRALTGRRPGRVPVDTEAVPWGHGANPSKDLDHSQSDCNQGYATVALWHIAVAVSNNGGGESPHPPLCHPGPGQDHAVDRDNPAYGEVDAATTAITPLIAVFGHTAGRACPR
jgi:hypothetical protein